MEAAINDYSDIIVTHNSLRDKSLYDNYCNHLKAGGEFDNNNPLLALFLTDKNLYLLRDGHHRFRALYDCDVKFNKEWFCVQNVTSDFLNKIHWDLQYVTPFNYETHCRKNNFWCFREAVILLEKNYGRDIAEEFIHTFGRRIYLERRNAWKIWEMTI